MKKHILLAMAMAFTPAFAQDAAPSEPTPATPPVGQNERRGPGGEHRTPNRQRISPQTMGMLVLARNLVLEKYDADKDGKLSDSERETIKTDIEAKKSEFTKKFDKDGNGKLSPEEWGEVRAAWVKANPKLEETVKELITSFAPRPAGPRGANANRPERSDRPERGPRGDRPEGDQNRVPRHPGPGNPFGMIGATGPHDPVIIATVCTIIEKYDADKDGILSEAEFQVFIDDAKTALEKRNEKMKEEMEKRHKEMLEKYDKDGDGKLSPEERQAMREDRRKSRQDNNNQ